MEHEEEILTLPAARPEFIYLSEDEVWKAVDEDDGNDPVNCEVTRLAAQYMMSIKAHCEQHGYVSSRMRFAPRCPIEKVAIHIVVRYVETAWVSGTVQ